MNNDHIVNAFDSIKPSEEQKKKMLENILKRKDKIHTIRFVPVISSIAAALLIFSAVYVYSIVNVSEKGNNTNDIQVVKETKLIENEKKEDNIEKNTDNIATDEADNNIEYKSDEESVAFLPISDAEEYNSKEFVEENVLLFNDFSLFLDSESRNTFSAKKFTGGSSSGGSGGGSNQVAALSDEEIRTESVTENKYEENRKKYFDYLGEDFTLKINLPSGVKEKRNENAVFPEKYDYCDNDAQTFVFSGDGNREIYVTTSKNTSLVDAYFSDENINKTVINNNETILFSKENVYGVYFIKNGVVYIIKTCFISEDELLKIVSSIII